MLAMKYYTVATAVLGVYSLSQQMDLGGECEDKNSFFN